MAWLAQCTDSRRNIVHVTPINDLVDHDRESFGSCLCGPKPEAVTGGWLFVHHSLDGREHTE